MCNEHEVCCGSCIPQGVGAVVPNFEMEFFQNEKMEKLKVHDYRGKWLVMFFYPADFTFVCPTELGELADHYEEFKKLGAEVVSVSRDTVFVHKAWHDQSPTIKKINFPMAADPCGEVSRYFGVNIEREGVTLRGTFIIDPEGVLKAYEVNDNSIGRSASELLRKLQAAIYTREHKGEACPASWAPGKNTLKPGLDLVGKI